MRIELKNVKYYPTMSEETNCFEATLYVNGKSYGRVVNHGQGAETEISREAYAVLGPYAKTLPLKTGDFGDGESFSYPQSSTSLVDDAFEEWHDKQEAKRIEKEAYKDYTTRICSEQDGHMMATRRLTKDQFQRAFTRAGEDAAAGKRAAPLNALPFDQFFATWKRLVLKQPTGHTHKG